MAMDEFDFDSVDDFPQAKFQRAGNKFVNITLFYPNNGSESYQKTENVEEVVEAAKEYEGRRQEMVDTNYNKDYTLISLFEELIQLLNPYKRYEVEGVLERDNVGNFFLGGYNTPIPDALAELIREYYEAGLDVDPLVEFWKKCLLNPNEDAREDLFEYISDHGITITDNGYMLLYKAVTTKENRVPDDDLAQFVGAEYLKGKNRGKNPADYYVYDLKDEVTPPNNHTAGPGFYVSTIKNLSSNVVLNGKVDGLTIESAIDNLGNLEELHDNVNKLSRESETVMTDKHSETFEYNLGEPHSEPREECDPNPARGCSRGLHVGSYDYVSSFGHSPRRDIIQAVLVNPMNVVCIPNHDNSKIRTCEFFSYAIMERDEDGTWEEVESPYFESDYEDAEEEALEERLEELNTSNPMEDSDVEGDQVKAAQDRLVDLRD